MKQKTCGKCDHYIPDSDGLNNDGECTLMGDRNDAPNAVDRCAGWDYEGYRAVVSVGPKFGCIHWIKKEMK
jgi:hypothetical protein